MSANTRAADCADTAVESAIWLFSMQKIAGQSPGGAEIDRLVPFTERGSAVAYERDGDALRSFSREGERDPGDRHRADRQRSSGREDAPFPVADVEILAAHRWTVLGHLRVEHHANGGRLRAHGQCDAQVADDRADDVALPSALAILPGRAARSRIAAA